MTWRTLSMSHGRLPRLAVAIVIIACVLAVPAGTARSVEAQEAPQKTAIGVSAPETAQLGETIMVKAKLVDLAGNAFPNATVEFSSPSEFLNTIADMIVATSLTDENGVATGQFQVRRSGTVSVKALFRGDDHYRASVAHTEVTVSGSAQLYQEDILPQVRGINAPLFGNVATAGTSRWLLTGWPIAAVLIIVWSSYAAAVLFMSRIAAAADDSSAPAESAGGTQ